MSDVSPVVQSEDFWFEDGDIILSVTVDDVEHHFRVHRTILTIASPVFRDMFLMPQPVECETPVVPLRDDSVHDLKALLGALYYARKAQTLTFDATLGIMRLSHKYQIGGLEEGMRWKLQKDWPLKHSDYLARLKALGSPRYRITQAIEVIETAQHYQANELLPTAFYELACAWGTQWEDIVGTLSSENVARLSVGRARFEQRLRALADDNKTSLLKPWGKKGMLLVPCASPGKWVNHPVPGCSGCPAIIPAFRIRVASLLLDGVFAIPAIQQCSGTDLGDACSNCKNVFVDILKNIIQELWKSIPALFDLPEVGPYSKVPSQSVNTS